MGQPFSLRELADARPPGTLLALLDGTTAPPTPDEVLGRLEGMGLEILRVVELDEGDQAPAFHVVAEISSEPEGLPLSIFVEAAREPLLSIGINWRGVTGEDEERARESRWALGLSCPFGERPLQDFHELTRMLHAIVPEPVLVVDQDSLVPRPGAWLAEVASAETPPSPTHLFSIHQVGDPDSTVAWLHTHGLARCGSIDLEILDAPAGDAGLLAQMLNAAAGLLLDRGIPEPGETFSVGQDLELLWLPWDQALDMESPRALGGRGDRDEAHTGARGVLFAAVAGGRPGNPSTHLPVLRDNPLLYVSTMETERMALLASERLPRFLALFQSQSEQEDWMFLVKLGYVIEDEPDADEREHLWFQVHGLDGSDVDATLLNAPYRLPKLVEGQRGRHSLDLLSDWAILCEKGRFDADTVGELERALLRDRELH